MELTGCGAKAEEESIGRGRAGVDLGGVYKTPAVVTTLGFGENGVFINSCGKLVDDKHSYTIDKRSGSTKVTIDNTPSPIVLTMRPDGGLIGPGPVDVKGLIITGYHTVTTTLMINAVRAAP